MTSVLIVDDHPVVLQGCRRILASARIRPIFEAGDTGQATSFFASIDPTVVVTDLSFRNSGLGSLSLIRRINADKRRVPIVVLSMHRDPNIVLQALEVGATAYVAKDADPEELVKAIREVQRGNRYLEHSLAIDVAVSRASSRPHLLVDLTPRELDVLILLAECKSYNDIAGKLGISYKTVVNTSWQLKKKLEADNLQALVQKAARLLRSADRPRS
jgi:DNA-binding NarL/FixJ family response regulator